MVSPGWATLIACCRLPPAGTTIVAAIACDENRRRPAQAEPARHRNFIGVQDRNARALPTRARLEARQAGARTALIGRAYGRARLLTELCERLPNADQQRAGS